MLLKSEIQKDTYEFDPMSQHVKVTKSDGKVWYMRIDDMRRIIYALDLESGIQSAVGKLRVALGADGKMDIGITSSQEVIE